MFHPPCAIISVCRKRMSPTGSSSISAKFRQDRGPGMATTTLSSSISGKPKNSSPRRKGAGRRLWSGRFGGAAAFHGSWNRERRTGYKIVRVPVDHSTGKALGECEGFVTGFVTPQGNVWGRPVGITVSKDGSLLFSEDGNDTIWRVSYGK